MLILLAMAGSVVAALVVGVYLSISVGEEEVPVFADEPRQRRIEIAPYAALEIVDEQGLQDKASENERAGNHEQSQAHQPQAERIAPQYSSPSV